VAVAELGQMVVTQTLAVAVAAQAVLLIQTLVQDNKLNYYHLTVQVMEILEEHQLFGVIK
jgi:hypothetical protein